MVSGATSLLIEGDRARLGRVLQNVIGNAVKYSPAATPVQVEIAADAEWVVMTVRDRGVGIPAAGMVLNDLNYRLAVPELEFIVNDCGAPYTCASNRDGLYFQNETRDFHRPCAE